VEGDQNLMLLPVVRKSVSKRLSDDTISVREAAFSLVGNYVVKSPRAIDSYQSALIPCLSDPGVSVRKRAVKIFQAILIENPSFQGRATVCNIMLQRCADPKEEDGVRDLLHEVFCTLWLRDGEVPAAGTHVPSVADREEQRASSTGLVTPDTPAPVVKRKGNPQRSDLAAEQMMEVVRAAGTGANLECLLKKLLSGGVGSDSERKQVERQKRQELGRKQCEQLVDSLFELLVVIDEQRNIREHVGKDIAATLTTIAVFANVAPLPTLKHLDTVLPYLKADNGVSKDDEVSIVCATCDVVFQISPVFDNRIITRLAGTSLAKDLSDVTYKFPPVALACAIRTFASLANHPIEGADESVFALKLLAVAQTFYGFAVKHSSIKDFSSTNVSDFLYFCACKLESLISFLRNFLLFRVRLPIEFTAHSQRWG
jgi:cohesin loading factor subunit SCC2